MSKKFTTKLSIILVLAVMLTVIPVGQANAATVLEYRMHNDKVVTLQKLLKAEGYNPGPVNGYFMYMTKRAVINFQEDNNLEETGDVDTETWNLLKSKAGQIDTPQNDNTNDNSGNSNNNNNNDNNNNNGNNDNNDNSQSPDNGQSQDDKKNENGNSGSETGDSSKVIMEYREHGAQVKELQLRLKKAGYRPGSTSGYYAYMTRRAVALFQRDNDLNITGTVDEVTWNLLKSKTGQIDIPQDDNTNDDSGNNNNDDNNNNDNNNNDNNDNSQSPDNGQSQDDKKNENGNSGSETGDSSKVIMKYREHGAQVKELQLRLKKAGYRPGSTSGYYAYMTRRAVALFQRDNDLNITGTVDEVTWNLLKSKTGQIDIPQDDNTNDDSGNNNNDDNNNNDNNDNSQDPNSGSNQGQQPDRNSGSQPTNPQTGQMTAEERKMLSLVNKERTQRGLEPLEVDMRLVRLARKKSRDMIQNNYFSHRSPTYGLPFDMLRNAGIRYRTAGENLAGNSTVTRAHTALMNSTGHRRNILKSDYTKIGIGIIDGGPYGKMFTQLFMDEF